MVKGTKAPSTDLLAALTVARRRAGLSQKALAAKIGTDQSYVSKVERGAVDLQTSTLVEIARSLGLELMLIPRQLVPAVQALRREITQGAPSNSVPAYRLGDDDA